jgi:hypothetical protein
MAFKRAEQTELPVKRGYGRRIGQRIAAAFPAAPDSHIERRPQDDIVDRRRNLPERLQEPWPKNAVEDDEIAAPGIAGRNPCQNVDDYGVLPMGFGQIGRDRSILEDALSRSLVVWRASAPPWFSPSPAPRSESEFPRHGPSC